MSKQGSAITKRIQSIVLSWLFTFLLHALKKFLNHWECNLKPTRKKRMGHSCATSRTSSYDPISSQELHGAKNDDNGQPEHTSKPQVVLSFLGCDNMSFVLCERCSSHSGAAW